MRTRPHPARRVAAALALCAGLSAGAATRAEEPDMRVDVAATGAPQQVQVVQRDFAVGQSSGWHIHRGVELAYVLRGDLQVTVSGRPSITVHAGDSFQVARDMPHEARNIGAAPAALIVTYVVDKGAPLKIKVPEPLSR